MGGSAGNPSLMALSHGYITGVRNNGSTGFPRMEIDKFCQDKVRLNLFLLAMADIQKNDNFYTDKWCWFQIQGIHGAPDIPWDGIGPDAYYKWLNANGLGSEAHDYTVANLTSNGITSDSALQNLTTAKLAPPTTGDPDWGFCTHGSVLFPTWHRVYEAMIEQSVQARMVTIADAFPAGSDIRRLSRTAAQQFRFPYWDPFQPRAGNTVNPSSLYAGLSMIFAVEKVQVRLPANPTVLTTIPNPLYSYTFPGKTAILNTVPSTEQDGTFWANFNISSTNTFRHADVSATNTTPGVKPGDSDNVDVERTLLSVMNSLMQKVYQSLTTDQKSYRKYANNYWQQSEDLAAGNALARQQKTDINGNPYSLEGWHNTVHSLLGGTLTIGGQMSDPTYAAFDPIFPFHHGNVDRNFALWQALWPTYWWSTGQSAARENNYTTITGTMEDPQAALLPFRKRIDSPIGASLFVNTFWRSVDVRDWTSLGYQYDDLPIPNPPLNFSTTPLSSAATNLTQVATNEVNARYGWFATSPSPSNAGLLNPSPMGNANIEAFLNPILYDGRTDPVTLYPPPATTATDHMVVKPTPEKAKETKEKVTVREKGKQTISNAKKSSPQVNGTKSSKSPESYPYTYIFPPSLIDSQNRIPEWIFNFRCLRHGLHTSFTVFVFLGDFPSNPSQWESTPSLILPLGQLVQHNPAAFEPNGAGPGGPPESRGRKLVPKKEDTTEEHRCARCKVQEKVGSLVADWAPLTMALLAYVKSGKQLPPADEILAGDPPGLVLRSLSPDDVVPFLQRNLHWRILRSDGEHIPRDQVPMFKAFVTERMMTLPRHQGELPKYDKTWVHFDVTHARLGGLQRGEMP